MKTQQELYESFLNSISKIPNDILDIYYSKKENINGLKLGEYNYKEKISYLESLTKKLMSQIKFDNYYVGASNANMDYGNSFFMSYRSKDNNIMSPFNIIASIPFKYYYIEQFRDRELLDEEKFILEQIIRLLENEGYRNLPKNICDTETDIVGSLSMPYNDFKDFIIKLNPNINNLSEKDQIEYILGTDYNGPYTVYNLVFGEHQ